MLRNGGPDVGDYQEKHNKHECDCYADFNRVTFPVIKVSCDLESTFSSWYREGDTFITGDSPYKCKFSL